MRRSIAGERPGHSATTAHLRAAYPFMADGGLGSRGVYIGRDALGASFAYDPWELYPHAITDPNWVVIGRIGSAKSSLVKTYLWRQAVFGRRAWVIDPKGEYGGLAAALGAQTIRLRPGGDVRLNPLTARGGWEGQLAVLRAVTAGVLDAPLTPEEDAALREALKALRRSAGEPTLPGVVERLLRPTDEMAAPLATTAPELARAARRAALGLQRLCEGDLAGMFDGPTTPGLDLDGRLVVIDLRSVYGSAALGILMTCATAWLRAMVPELEDEDKLIVVIEEAWRVYRVLDTAEQLQESTKLSREVGQHISVMHRFSDLLSAGDEGSRLVRLAEGMLADTQTRIVYAQTPDQVPLTRELLGLTQTEAELLPVLRRGEALWKVGNRSFLVQHRISGIEAKIVYTDARMRAGRHRARRSSGDVDQRAA